MKKLKKLKKIMFILLILPVILIPSLIVKAEENELNEKIDGIIKNKPIIIYSNGKVSRIADLNSQPIVISDKDGLVSNNLQFIVFSDYSNEDNTTIITIKSLDNDKTSSFKLKEKLITYMWSPKDRQLELRNNAQGVGQ